jgi:hypothetical protein
VERFLAANGQPIRDANPDSDVPMVERIAAGEATPNQIIDWLEGRTSGELP